MILEKQLLLLINLSKIFKTVVSLPRSGCPSKVTPRSDHAMLRDFVKKKKKTRATQTLHASVSIIHFKFMTVRKLK